MKRKKKINNLFEALSNFTLLKNEFEELEFLIFRSGKPYNTSSVEYRLDTWRSKVDQLPKLVKFFNFKTMNDLSIREISIRSRLVKIERIEKEIKE